MTPCPAMPRPPGMATSIWRHRAQPTTPARRPPPDGSSPLSPRRAPSRCTRARWAWPAWLGCSKAPSPRFERHVARHRAARREVVRFDDPAGALHAERGGAQLSRETGIASDLHPRCALASRSEHGEFPRVTRDDDTLAGAALLLGAPR